MTQERPKKNASRDRTEASKEEKIDPSAQSGKQKKPFVQPHVNKYGSLPKVTGQSFIGTFSP